MGFVAILGIIALSGMIIRNSVILIDQIDMDLARGLHPWDAVIDATTNTLITTIRLGGGAGNTVYDPGSGRILVAVHENN